MATANLLRSSRWFSGAFAISRRFLSSSRLPNDNKTLSDFIRQSSPPSSSSDPIPGVDPSDQVLADQAYAFNEITQSSVATSTRQKTFFIESYGCQVWSFGLDERTFVVRSSTHFVLLFRVQMNVADSEIVCSIVTKSGFKQTDDYKNVCWLADSLLLSLQSVSNCQCLFHSQADVILVNTCAIRENAEQKIWSRLNDFRTVKREKKRLNKHRAAPEPLPIVGVLGTLFNKYKQSRIYLHRQQDKEIFAWM